MRLPSRFRDSLYLNAWIRDLKVNLRRDSELIQGMRDAKKIIGTTGLSENWVRMTVLENITGDSSWSVCGNLDSCQSSVSQLPSRAGRILPYLLWSGTCCWTRYGFHDITLVSKEVFIPIPLLIVQLTPDNSNQNRLSLDFLHAFTVILPSSDPR